MQNNKKGSSEVYSTVHSTVPCAWCTFERKILHPSITSGLSARINIHFGQRRQPLVAMLRWIIVLRLQQRCKEVRNDASSQLEAIDAVWCKLIEYCSQMPTKRFTNAGLGERPFLNPSFAVCNQYTLMICTIVHSMCMFDFLFFSEKGKTYACGRRET